MPKICRVTRNNLIWEYSPGDYSWVDGDDIPSDPVTDLRTTENSLSIWIIKDDSSDLTRCLSAFAAERKEVDKLDYIIFDETVLSRANVQIKVIESKLKDKEINRNHRDLIELSTEKLVNLAKIILSKCERGRIKKDDVAGIIWLSISNGWIQKESLHQNLLDELEKRFPVT